MRVLHIASHLKVGGVTSYLLSLCRGLQRRGHKTVVFSGTGEVAAAVAASGADIWEAPLHTSAEFSFQVLRAKQQLFTRLRQEKADVIHAHTRVGQVVAHAASRKLNIPYVATWHGFFRMNLGRWLWPCTGDRTIAISEPVRAHLANDFRVPDSRIRLIPHGIDSALFQSPPDAVQQKALRDKLSLPSQAKIVGTIARLVPSKGVDLLLKALPFINRKHPDAHLLIVGEGEARPALAALADKLSLSQQVHFAGALEQTSAALSLMDVFVFLPADKEGFGLSLLEAMAAGRPIVAVRRGGGSTWLLDEARVGSIVASSEPALLAKAVTDYLDDGALAVQAGEEARKAAVSRYGIERMIDQTLAVYQELVR